MYDHVEVSLNQPPTGPRDQMLEDSEEQMMQDPDAVFSNRCTYKGVNSGLGACLLVCLAGGCMCVWLVKTESAVF